MTLQPPVARGSPLMTMRPSPLAFLGVRAVSIVILVSVGLVRCGSRRRMVAFLAAADR